MPHTTIISIDENVDVHIKIPERLDASEFLALLTTAKQLANIRPTTRTQIAEKVQKSVRNGKTIRWTDEMIATLKKEWNEKKGKNENARRIGKILDVQTKKVYNKQHNLREKGEW